MKILAGGPAREIESEMFRLHVEGLKAQEGFDLHVRHELVPDDDGPRWHHDKIERVAKVREEFVGRARAGGLSVREWESGNEDFPPPFDALLLVDTDVILGPGVLERMWAVDADVVYGVFWTEAEWGQPEGPVAPQVWRAHPYRFDRPTWEALTEPGVNEVEVYGGGACTLIRGRGFESRYWPLLESVRWNGGIWGGEDRSFALGLETRGIRQVAVTGLPIVHCYGDDMKTEKALAKAAKDVGLR